MAVRRGNCVIGIYAYCWSMDSLSKSQAGQRRVDDEECHDVFATENIRNRISPHFIFNVLNREISSLKDRESNHRLYELVKLIRYNLELTESLAVTLAEELDFVKTYIGLEEQVLQPGFEFHIDIDPALDIHRVKIPVMLLQIPVENAVKHALSCKDGIRMLWIEVKKIKIVLRLWYVIMVEALK